MSLTEIAFPMPPTAPTRPFKTTNTPTYFPLCSDTEAQKAARGLLPNAHLPDGWETGHGLPGGQYLISLFNMEGCLLTGGLLTENMLWAGMQLVLQDLRRDEKIWWTSEWVFQRGVSLAFGPNLRDDVADARYLVLPCIVRDREDSRQQDQQDSPQEPDTGSNHWVVAIFDKVRHAVFWYNTYPEYSTRWTKVELANLLVEAEIVMTRPAHVDVDVTGQVGGWECGLLVLDCIRTFFRERVLCGETSHVDWAASHLHAYMANYSRTKIAEDRVDVAEKIEAVRWAWVAMIRAHLGSYRHDPIRDPEVPDHDWDVAGVEELLLPKKEPKIAKREVVKADRTEAHFLTWVLTVTRAAILEIEQQ